MSPIRWSVWLQRRNLFREPTRDLQLAISIGLGRDQTDGRIGTRLSAGGVAGVALLESEAVRGSTYRSRRTLPMLWKKAMSDRPPRKAELV